MGAVESVLYIFGILLVVTIVAVLIRIYYIVQQQGIQISILLKHEKEGYVPHDRYVQIMNKSRCSKNGIIPSDKQLECSDRPRNVSSNTRAQQPCAAMTDASLKCYSGEAACISDEPDGLAGIVNTAKRLGVDVNTTLVNGANSVNAADFNTTSNYNASKEGFAAVDQTGVNLRSNPSNIANVRNCPAFMSSMTEGFKAAHEHSKSRYRERRKEGFSAK